MVVAVVVVVVVVVCSSDCGAAQQGFAVKLAVHFRRSFSLSLSFSVHLSSVAVAGSLLLLEPLSFSRLGRGQARSLLFQKYRCVNICMTPAIAIARGKERPLTHLPTPTPPPLGPA